MKTATAKNGNGKATRVEQAFRQALPLLRKARKLMTGVMRDEGDRLTMGYHLLEGLDSAIGFAARLSLTSRCPSRTQENIMLVILTALIILPEDVAAKGIAKKKDALSRRFDNLNELAKQFQIQIKETDGRVPLCPKDSPERERHLTQLARLQTFLDHIRMDIDVAERAELRGPPFASAIWRVRVDLPRGEAAPKE